MVTWEETKKAEHGNHAQLFCLVVSVAYSTPTSVSYFDLTGRRVNTTQKGVIIKRETLAGGTVRYQKVSVK